MKNDRFLTSRLGLRLVLFALLTISLLTPAARGFVKNQEGEPSGQPKDFQQVVPRGRIASIDDPVFVSVEEAEIRDEAWVLGVEVAGEARAYSLNILNSHEVVNDRFAGQPVAAVW